MESTEKTFFIWVDWKKRIISFHAEKGYERLSFSTHREMFLFAVEKGREGFGIQKKAGGTIVPPAFSFCHETPFSPAKNYPLPVFREGVCKRFK